MEINFFKTSSHISLKENKFLLNIQNQNSEKKQKKKKNTEEEKERKKIKMFYTRL